MGPVEGVTWQCGLWPVWAPGRGCGHVCAWRKKGNAAVVLN